MMSRNPRVSGIVQSAMLRVPHFACSAPSLAQMSAKSQPPQELADAGAVRRLRGGEQCPNCNSARSSHVPICRPTFRVAGTHPAQAFG